MSKIVVDVLGGLGNQFFIYSSARGISRKAILNINWYNSNMDCTSREYALDKYNIILPTISKTELELNKLKRKFQILLGDRNGYIYHEREFGVFDEYVASGKAEYLNGYWQNIKYFEHIIPELKKELTYKMPLSQKAAYSIEQVKNCNSVAVHVRRGDYIKLQDYYCLPTIAFYAEAVEILNSEIGDCKLFIFSDDINWCREAFSGFNDAIFIDSGCSDSMYEEFEIMQNCKHFVIPNSTFSWWAAFLSEADANKKVITTKNWYVAQTMNENCLNAIIPQSWRLI